MPVSAKGEPARGTMIGRFIVLEPLGAGGMGVVLLAYDPVLDRKVAIKLLRPHEASSDRVLRLVREAQAMAKIAHPNVRTVHEAGPFGSEVFVAMEHVDGTTLSRWLDGSRSV